MRRLLLRNGAENCKVEREGRVTNGKTDKANRRIGFRRTEARREAQKI